MIWFGRAGAGPALLIAMIALASPATAQVAPANSGAPADIVGPRELHNFSLGTPATNQLAVPPDLISQPSRPRPRPAAPLTQTAPAPRVATTPAPAPTRAAQNEAMPETKAATPAKSAPQPVTVPLPKAAPIFGPATPANENVPVEVSTSPMTPDPAPRDDDGLTVLMPWLLALLVIVLAALGYALRDRLPGRRSKTALAAGVALDPVDEDFAAPATVVPHALPVGGISVRRQDPLAPREPARPPPAPTSARPTGIVSTRLRPWLEMAFDPSRAVIDETNASVQFDVAITNSGNAPARNVLVEACMINAGAEQDSELGRFFDAPVGQGDRIDAIPPLGSVTLKSAVSLPRDQVRAYQIEGRQLFVPVVAFNALYEWGSGTGQTSASFLLGRGAGGGEGEGAEPSRMAPMRLDLGPRLFRDLEARRHPMGVRR